MFNYEHERFLKFLKVSGSTLCWNYTGDKTPDGYGRFYFVKPKRVALAHRISYELFIGELTKPLVIDHICRNKSCCNPDHLRQVDRRTNVIENSKANAFFNSIKTHCKMGHEFTEENTLIDPKHSRSKQGVLWRKCKICIKAYKSQWNEARKRKCASL